ncbi:hypothetical protein [Lacticaseibacillus absianus]|uniref:hypothetical protein n=1 Tax=Lacticaseibacillus absianus TaxID=2729623 RepID=UPI0015C932B2|nr:hypothetical protein [Lacticaseibacillus absianus]
MNDIYNFQQVIQRVEVGMLVLMALFGNLGLFVTASVFIAVFLSVKVALTAQYTKRLRLVLILAYLALMTLQIVFDVNTVFLAAGMTRRLLRVIATLFLPVPFLVEFLVMRSKTDVFYLPRLGELATISFAEFQENRERIRQALHSADRVKNVFSVDHVRTLFGDLHRHSAMRYINGGSLDADYFRRATTALADPALYLVISNTGSPASELIALFTEKQFNHASLSFDAALSTIISYNGGERVYPPGLNPEMVEAFHKKPDASVLVYRLPVTRDQKQRVLETIREINLTGSAYNILGLVTKHSLRRNIMFCSQFVYTMLQVADATYFTKHPGDVRPTDFIELDYRRKLEYVTEIRF